MVREMEMETISHIPGRCSERYVISHGDEASPLGDASRSQFPG
jgi:hypothetical protein